jgi:molecular chaperone HscB
MQNYFALFNLPEQFDLDKQVLDAAWRTIQKEAHPDRFVYSPESEKRAALEWASLANDAYQVLRNPVKRAAHLCHIKGYREDAGLPVPSDFIFEQIEWRELLDNARIDNDFEGLEKISNRLRERITGQMQLIKKELDSDCFADALQEIRKMIFLQKFSEEVSVVFDELDESE